LVSSALASVQWLASSSTPNDKKMLANDFTRHSKVNIYSFPACCIHRRWLTLVFLPISQQPQQHTLLCALTLHLEPFIYRMSFLLFLWALMLRSVRVNILPCSWIIIHILSNAFNNFDQSNGTSRLYTFI
jgi:hypothetical protein